MSGRDEGFEIMTDHIRGLEYPLVIETGCIRDLGAAESDGHSTIILDQATKKGEFHTVDIDPEACELARKMTKRAYVHCSDSVAWLQQFKPSKRIDLIYLDSLDGHLEGSAEHHLKELLAVWKHLGEGSMVAVDDAPEKGRLVMEHMEKLGYEPIHQGLQIIWLLS